MKRLMVAIAAVASAFGLYAADPITSTSFEGTSEFDEGGNLITGSAWTASADPDAKLTQGAYDGDDYTYTTDNDRYPVFGDDQDSYLSIKTALDKPAAYAIGDEGALVEEGAAVYFDQLVKFTAADEDIAVTDTDAKIAFYVKDLTEAETPKAETNLYVVAGKYVGGALEKAVYEVKKGIDADAWHRLTVKAIKATGGSVGFEVFLDAVALPTGVNAYDGVEANLTDAARPLNNVKKLFPSLVEGKSVISSLAYAGQGAIDDVIATVDQPGAWAEDKNVSVSWNENVTALTYTINGGDPITATVTDGIFEVPYESGLTITVNPTFAENWAFGGFDGEGFTQDDKTISFTSDTGSAAIISKDVTPRLVVVGDDGEPTGVTYPSFKAALADEALESGAALKLAMDVEIGVGDEGVTDGVITKDLTIDLNGKTISGVEDASDTYVFTVAGCTLTVKDSSGTNAGAIQPGADYLGAVLVASTDADNIGQIVVEGGTFEGAVTLNPEDPEFDVPAGTASIAGGLFVKEGNSTEDEKFALADSLAEGYKVGASAGDYWEVVPKDKFTVSVTGAANATVTINDVETASLELNEGDDYTVVVTPKAYYEYAEEGSYGAFTWTEGTLVATGTANAAVALTAADATAVQWTISYYDAADESETPTAVKEETYTIESRETQQLWDGDRTAEQLVFKGWQDDQLVDITDPDTYLQDKTGNLSVYGTWEAAAPTEYTVTLSYSDTEIATVEATVGGAGVTITDKKFTAADGAAIVITATAQDGYENVTYTPGNSFTLEADTTVTIAATKKAEPVDPTEPYEAKDETEATNIASGFNSGSIDKANYLKPPYGDNSAAYLNCFKATANGKQVTFALSEAGEATLKALEDAATATFTADSTTLTIANPISGCYYSLKQSAALESLDFDANQINKEASAATFTLTKGEAAGFYQIVITPTVVEAE